MHLKSEFVHKVYDSTGKKIFKFPDNTILNIIVLDLWNDIAKYMCYHPFMICNAVGYPFYRKMTDDEFHIVKHKMMDYHSKNEGIPIAPNYTIPNIIAIAIDVNKSITGNNNYGITGHLSSEKMIFHICNQYVTRDHNLNFHCIGTNRNNTIVMIFDPNLLSP